MDPQIEEYRRKQREKAAAAAASKPRGSAFGGGKQSWILMAAAVSAAALIAVVHSNGQQSAPQAQGQCPQPNGVGICVEECSKHDDCEAQGKLCCSNGCGHVCMAPEVQDAAKKYTLLVTLAAEDKSEAVLQAVPAPSQHSILATVGIVILDYDAGRSLDCCAAERKLLALPNVAKAVEYDGAKPDCASSSASGLVEAGEGGEVGEGGEGGEVGEIGVMEPDEEEPLMGGVGDSTAPDEESLAVWSQVLEKNPRHDDHELKSFGKPVSVKTQVVAGTNYFFKFSGGGTVSVFHQPWTDTLEVTGVQP